MSVPGLDDNSPIHMFRYNILGYAAAMGINTLSPALASTAWTTTAVVSTLDAIVYYGEKVVEIDQEKEFKPLKFLRFVAEHSVAVIVTTANMHFSYLSIRKNPDRHPRDFSEDTLSLEEKTLCVAGAVFGVYIYGRNLYFSYQFAREIKRLKETTELLLRNSEVVQAENHLKAEQAKSQNKEDTSGKLKKSVRLSVISTLACAILTAEGVGIATLFLGQSAAVAGVANFAPYIIGCTAVVTAGTFTGRMIGWIKP